MTDFVPAALKTIQQQAGTSSAKIGIVLGSGLAEVLEHMTDASVVDTNELAGFPHNNVEGHHGTLTIGKLHGVEVACLSGRPHLYEGATADNFKTVFRTLKALGCDRVILTNAAGSLHADAGPGSLFCVQDHINFHFSNPLIGPNDDAYGPRFLGMDNAYDQAMGAVLQQNATKYKINLRSGVYISTLGPMFETPAEIRAFKILGADIVGMSTVPEVITARHCGLRVCVISMITNLAAGMSEQLLSHEVTLSGAKQGIQSLIKLLEGSLPALADC